MELEVGKYYIVRQDYTGNPETDRARGPCRARGISPKTFYCERSYYPNGRILNSGEHSLDIVAEGLKENVQKKMFFYRWIDGIKTLVGSGTRT